jgi:signal transduction histidine kinase
MTTPILRLWRQQSLARQFALAAFAVLAPCAVVIAIVLPPTITNAVVNNAAAGTVVYLDGILAPFVDEIATTGKLSPESRASLDSRVAAARPESNIVAIKIWSLDSRIIHSTYSEMIGQKHPPSDDFLLAKSGTLGAGIEEEEHAEDDNEQQADVPLLEVYAPLHAHPSRDIVAVSEFYADGTKLSQDLVTVRRQIWTIIGAATALLIAILSLIVGRGSQTIIQQRGQLVDRISDMEELLKQNTSLREKLRQANEDVSSANEQVLQRVGADLHDGPAQLLTFALLRLSKLRKWFSKTPAAEADVKDMSEILSAALKDVRQISQGLALPELDGLDVAQSINKAVQAHRDYTDTAVALNIQLTRQYRNAALRTCAYRFVQEALANSFKHAGGKGQTVEVSDSNGITISVSDSGKGNDSFTTEGVKLGLRGMRARIEAIGGQLDLALAGKTGTTVIARFPANVDWIEEKA